MMRDVIVGILAGLAALGALHVLQRPHKPPPGV